MNTGPTDHSILFHKFSSSLFDNDRAKTTIASRKRDSSAILQPLCIFEAAPQHKNDLFTLSRKNHELRCINGDWYHSQYISNSGQPIGSFPLIADFSMNCVLMDSRFSIYHSFKLHNWTEKYVTMSPRNPIRSTNSPMHPRTRWSVEKVCVETSSANIFFT